MANLEFASMPVQGFAIATEVVRCSILEAVSPVTLVPATPFFRIVTETELAIRTIYAPELPQMPEYGKRANGLVVPAVNTEIVKR